jgi:general secretion pathway protein D
LGLNFAIFSSDDFSLVLNALKTVGDVRVSSAPKILVQDNAVAMISQLSQEPYETTSQGESSTITSFGGFVDAGTTLTVNPHISQENWLRMDYEVMLSTFGQRNAQQLAANLPPPKRETKAVGTVRVPAEHVIVLGGLVGERQDNTLDSVPYAADVPLVGELFKNRTSSSMKETMYIFIRPVILRDPSFHDLIYLSEKDIREARIRRNEAPSNPLKTFDPMERHENNTTKGS